MAVEVTKHGLSGYRNRCRCETCRRAKRDYMRGYRARVKAKAAAEAEAEAPLVKLAPLREPLELPLSGLDMAAAPGAIERAFVRDIRKPTDKVAFRRTLVRLGRLNARILDQIGTLDRLDLVSPLQLRQLEVLQRLAVIGFSGVGAPELDVPDDVSELMQALAGEDG